jgi:hypothetical protein
VLAALCCILLFPSAVLAAPIDLNLQSTQASLHTSTVKPVNITVGGRIERVVMSTALTPAEYIAAQQILQTGKQSLVIDKLGVASGGSFSISNFTGLDTGNLVVPRGVKAYAAFTETNRLATSGTLTNFGSIYAFSTSAASQAGTIFAANIINESLATITSALPTGTAQQLRASLTPFDLSLAASGKITNFGTIASSGSLSLTAPNIRNAGNIVSGQDVHIASPSPGNLQINGTVGCMYAANSIVISNAASTPAQSIQLSGGDYFSQQLNINAGQGTISGDVGKVTGTINLTANSAELGAATPLLKLGTLNVTGDPTYYNAQGSIEITSCINTNGQDLALLASGDVIIKNNAQLNTLNQTECTSGNLTIIAGASLDTSDNSVSGSGDSNTVVTVNGPSPTGGAIDFTGAFGAATTGAYANGNTGPGGDILLVAYAGTGAGNGLTAGTINLSCLAGGVSAGGATGGNITVIAGATSLPAGQSGIVLPVYPASLYAPNGTVDFYNATPVGSITVQNGTVTSGSIQAGQLQPISFGNPSTFATLFTTYAKSFSVHTAGDVYLWAGAGSDVTLGSLEFGNDFEFLSSGTLLLQGNITGSGPNSRFTAATLAYPNTNVDITMAAQTHVSVGSMVISGAGNVIAAPNASKDVSINAAGSITLGESAAGGAFTATAGKDMTVNGNITAGKTLTLTSGTVGSSILQLAPGSMLLAGDSITLRNGDSHTGSIVIGSNATIDSAGQVAIFMGNWATPLQGTAPAAVTISQTNGGTVYMGAAGVTANGIPNNISANINDVLFSTSSLDGSAITLDGGVSIYSGHGSSPVLVISSLDLTDPAAVSRLVQFQQQFPAQVGGELVVNEGIATGGNLIIASAVNLDNVFSHNIPAGVTVTYQDFQGNKPINIYLDSNSHTPQAVIAGTERFLSTSGTSAAIVNVTSLNTSPVFASSGQLLSDGTVAITANGDICSSGTIQASGCGLSIRSTSGSNGNLSVAGMISSSGTISLVADGTGSIQQSAGTISGATTSIMSKSGSISLSGQTLCSGAITIATTGDVLLANVQAAGLTTGPKLNTLTINGWLNANQVESAGAGGSITLTATSVVLAPGAKLSANASGDGSFNGGSISVTAATIAVTASSPISISANGSGTGAGGSITLAASDTSQGSITVDSTGSALLISATGGTPNSPAGDGGKVRITAGNMLSISPSALLAGPLGSSGAGPVFWLNGGDGSFVRSELGGSGGAGSLVISGSLVADGAGSANGGSITLLSGTGGLQVAGDLTANANSGNAGNIVLYMDSLSLLTVGTATGTNFVGGRIAADSLSGLPGTLTFANWNGHTGSNLLSFVINSSISAKQATGSAYGSVTFLSSPTLSGVGTFDGLVCGSANTTINSSLTGVLRLGHFKDYNDPTMFLSLTVNQTNGGSIEIYGPITANLRLCTTGSGSINEIPDASVSGSLSLSVDTGTVNLVSSKNAILSAWGESNGTVNLYTPNQFTLSGFSANTTLFAKSDTEIDFGFQGYSGSSVITAPLITFHIYGKWSGVGNQDFETARIITSEASITSSNGNVTFNAITPGPISISNVGITAGGANGQIVFNGSSGAVSVNASSLSGLINASGSTVDISVSGHLPASGWAVANTLTTGSIAATGNVSLTAPGSLTATGTVSTSGVINLMTPEISGTGAFTGTGGVNIGSTSNLNLSGSLSFSKNTSISLPAHTVTVANGSSVNVQGNLNISALNIVNPDAFTVTGITTFNFTSGPQSSGYGTITNPAGDVVLAANTIINASGKDVAILAHGNVIASGASLINLSSTTGKGGTLSVFAGFNFSPAQLVTGQSLDNTTLFNVAGSSDTGGNIEMSGTTILTSSSALKTADAGSIFLFANGGTNSAGTIRVGSLRATSLSGSGGQVGIVGQGGVVVAGSITTNGRGSGGSVVLSGAPVSVSVAIINGELQSMPDMTALPISGSGAAVTVTGAITTSATVAGTYAYGGSVKIAAAGQVCVAGITTSSQIHGGSVSLSSVDGYVQVSGSITSSGYALSKPSTYGSGSGGTISVSAPSFINISGNISAAGGYDSSGATAGEGANVSLITNDSNHIGNIMVKGYINTSGGSVPLSAGSPGGAGNVTIDSGSVQILGAIASPGGTACINASGGFKPGVGYYSGGSIVINTYSTQLVPANFNLTSTASTEYALPGGLFTIGKVPVVNGVAHAIVSNGSFVATNSGFSGNLTLGTISLTAGIGSFNLSSASGVHTYGAVIAGTTNVRQTVTPAEALALYQLSSGSSQTIQLNGDRTAGGSVTQPSTVTINQSQVPVAFKSFVLSASSLYGAPEAISVSFAGMTPVLNLTAATPVSIRGELDFASSGAVAWMNLGSKTLNIPALASIQSATGTNVLVTASSFTNSGSLLGTSILLAQRGMTLTNYGVASSLGVIGTSAPAVVTVNNQGSLYSVALFSAPLPSVFSGISSTFSDPLKNGSLTMNFAGKWAAPVPIAGTWSGGSLTLNDLVSAGIASGINGDYSSGNINIRTGGSFVMSGSLVSLHGAISIDAGEKIEATSVANIWGQTGVRLNSPGPITVVHTWIATSTGYIKVQSGGELVVDGLIQAGGYRGFPQTTTDLDSSAAGGVQLTSAQGGIQIQYGSNITSNLANITVTANGQGSIQLGSGQSTCCYTNLTARGGNVYLLASGSVTQAGISQSPNAITANSVAAGKGYKGGIIGIFAGTTNPALAASITGHVAGTRPTAGTIGVYSDLHPTLGVLLASPLPLGTISVQNATFVMTGGGVALQTVGPGHSINLPAAEFATSGYNKPVGYVIETEIDMGEDFIVEVGDDDAWSSGEPGQ